MKHSDQTMRFKTHSIEPILLFGTIVGCACVLSNSFMETSIFPKWILFGYGTAVLLIWLVIYNYFNKNINFSNYDLLLFVISISLIILVLFKDYTNSDVTNWIIFSGFCIAGNLCSRHTNIHQISAHAFITAAGISAIITIKQLFGKNDPTGCYDNLVGLDITLILGILSTFYLLKTYSCSKTRRLILYSLSILYFILALITGARLVLLTIALCIITYFPRIAKYILIPSLLILFLITYINSNKYESTYGRGFILKTSLTLLDSPSKILTGYGENGFKSHYMIRQAEQLQLATDAEKQRAANIVHPLNEFLLMSIKYGIILPCLILVTLIYLLFTKTTSAFDKVIILTIVTYALFSYPLKYPISWVALAIVITSAIRSRRICRTAKYVNIVYIALLILGTTILAIMTNSAYLHRDWKKANTHAVLGQEQRALSIYRKLSKKLKTDEFMYNYSSYLHNLGNDVEAIAVLSDMHLIDYETMMLSGNINVSLQQYEDALNDFNLAYNMCPNRFSPLFEIYKIYKSTDNIEKQEYYVNLILNKQVKIQSPQIEYIINYITNR